MKKHKLVIATVLKPVDDTRMYEKFGLSLSQTNKYEINIIGFSPKKIPVSKNIRFHPIYNFRRLQLKRVFAPLKCLYNYIKLKPELIIANTHEILIVTILYKILFGCKIVYDIRENHYRNILYTNNFPIIFRPVLACYIRSKEYFSRLFFDYYFLAEKRYENEFTFSRNKNITLENKYKRPDPFIKMEKRPFKTSGKKLLFTGTLAQSTGIFQCIDLAKSLHAYDDAVELHIAGYCSIPSVYQKIQKAISGHGFITLTGGDTLISHAVILKAIKRADFGIIYYPWNKSTMNTMPTKLYEYLGNRLPILLQNHKPWVELCDKYHASVILDIEHLQPENLLKTMSACSFYNYSPGPELLWESEEEKLLKTVDFLIHNKL